MERQDQQKVEHQSLLPSQNGNNTQSQQLSQAQAKRGRGRPPKQQNQQNNAAFPPEVETNIENPQARDFLCQVCGKTYLSNPALYHHMKGKHGGVQNVGNNQNIQNQLAINIAQNVALAGTLISTGTISGEDIQDTNDTSDKTVDEKISQIAQFIKSDQVDNNLQNSSSLSEMKKGRGRPRKIGYCDYSQLQNLNYQNLGRADPCGMLFLCSPEKIGGPTDIMTGFFPLVSMILGDRLPDQTKHPMYEYMRSFSFEITPSGHPPELYVQSKKKLFNDVTKEIRQHPEGKKNMLNCEQIFTIYLREVSYITNSNYYTNIMMKFILMFRECLNIYGWQKRAEHEIKQYYGTDEYHSRYQQKMEYFQKFGVYSDYTGINNCEFAPEIANEFVTVFLDDPINNRTRLERADAIDLTQHFCNWLFINKLTCSKLSMAT